ncbi:MAG: hypothetical protein NW226_17695 [Microscillaceae bacterium]|nr:hypothetical protein [Microscillaceae bacterium]
MQEQLLIDRIRAGDIKALGNVYEACKVYFMKYVTSRYPLLKEREMLEDIYHEVILIFYQNVVSEKLVRLESRLSTYIVSVGVFYLINIIKVLNKESKFLEEFEIKELEFDESFLDPEIIEPLVKELEVHIKKLDEGCEALIRNFFYEKKKIQEIAKEMNIQV